MRKVQKFVVAAATAALLSAGVGAAPAQAAKPGGAVTPQASSICMIFHWWPFGC